MVDYIQVPADGTGKKSRQREHVVGPDTVHVQTIHIEDPDDPTKAASVGDDGLYVEVRKSALPTGGATAANQATEIAGLAALLAALSGTLNVSGTVAVTNGATAAKQDSGNTSLASIDTKTPALGQALAAASVPVILPAATITTLTPPAAITGFATSAKQDSGNTSLSSIDGKLPALVSSRVPVDPSGVTSPVSDAGGSLTVDAPVGTPAFVRLSDGSAAISTLPVSLASVPSHVVTSPTAANLKVEATIAAAQTLATVTNVATIGTSVTPGTSAAHLGKAEDAVHASGDTGVMALGVRQDADTSPVSASGDYHAMLFDALGNLKVNIKAGSAGGGTLKTAPGASSAITISLASLASDANLLVGRASDAIDNSTAKYLDYLIAGVIRNGTSPTTAKEIRVYVVGLLNDTTYPDAVTGSDAAKTWTTSNVRDSAARLAAVMATSSSSNEDNYFGPLSVASLFGGVLPKKFVVFVVQSTGVALNATAGQHVISITPFAQTLS